MLRLATDQQLLKYVLDDKDDMTEHSNIDFPLVSVQDGTTEDSELDLLVEKEESFSGSPEQTETRPQEQNSSHPQFIGGKTRINLLPKGFSFMNQMGCLTYGSINLPEGHHILLHATDPAANVTVFLCAGSGTKFSPTCPYLIILLIQGDTFVIDGIVVNPDCSIVGFLSDVERRSGTVNIRAKFMPNIQAAVDVILPNMLIENGFKNLSTVIHWTKCHWYVENVLHLPVWGRLSLCKFHGECDCASSIKMLASR